MKNINKVIIFSLIFFGFGLQAGAKENVIKGFKWVPAAVAWGLIGASLSSMHQATDDKGQVVFLGQKLNYGNSFLNKKLNFGSYESFMAGLTYLQMSGLKYLPFIGTYLDNNFGYYALGALFINKIRNSEYLARQKDKENAKNSYNCIVKSCDSEDNRLVRAIEENIRFHEWNKTYAACVVSVLFVKFLERNSQKR